MGIKSVEHFVKSHLAGLLVSMFSGIDFTDRFTVERELDKWKPETKYLWEVKKGKRNEHYEVSFDDEFICSFSEDDTIKQVENKFLSGFLEAYQKRRIFLNKELYKEEEEKRKIEEAAKKAKKQAEREKDLQKLSPEEKKIAKEVLDETAR